MRIIDEKANGLWGGLSGQSLFTIVTPVYNRRETPPRTLESVAGQTSKNLEHIIVDDGSSDPCDDLVERYLSDAEYPVLYVKKENGGVHTARNIAIERARETYAVFLDSDDEIVPNALERLQMI